MRFWDSSALVPLCVDEPATDAALALLAEDPEVAVWWATPVECASALARLERDGAFVPEAASDAFARLPRNVHEVIVVDARSVDRTVDVALRLWPGVRVLEQTGSGKGDALALGFAAATGDVVVTIDADGSHDPAEIPMFVAALVAGADLVKGSRFLPGGGSHDLTPLRRAGAVWLTWLVNVLFRTAYTDLCYGYNAFWRDCSGCMATGTGFEVEAAMHISASRAGLVVTEVPSFERARQYGQSNLRTIRDGIRVLSAILRQRATRAPEPQPSAARA